MGSGFEPQAPHSSELKVCAFRSVSFRLRVAVVPGATHLFEEPGTLAAAPALAREWYLRYLTPPPAEDAASAPRRR